MFGLDMWATKDNVTIQYRGNNPLFGSTNVLCQNSNCYQDMATSSPMVYRVCDINCFGRLENCSGPVER